MFRYNSKTFTIDDVDRGLIVKQTAGPGHGVFAGEMSGANGRFRFLASRESDKSRVENGVVVPNPDYSIKLHVATYPVEGDLGCEASPQELAREAAFALETGFYRTSPDRIRTSTSDSEVSNCGI